MVPGKPKQLPNMPMVVKTRAHSFFISQIPFIQTDHMEYSAILVITTVLSIFFTWLSPHLLNRESVLFKV